MITINNFLVLFLITCLAPLIWLKILHKNIFIKINCNNFIHIFFLNFAVEATFVCFLFNFIAHVFFIFTSFLKLFNCVPSIKLKCSTARNSIFAVECLFGALSFADSWYCFNTSTVECPCHKIPRYFFWNDNTSVWRWLHYM